MHPAPVTTLHYTTLHYNTIQYTTLPSTTPDVSSSIDTLFIVGGISHLTSALFDEGHTLRIYTETAHYTPRSKLHSTLNTELNTAHSTLKVILQLS